MSVRVNSNGRLKGRNRHLIRAQKPRRGGRVEGKRGMRELICSTHINYAITPLICADLDELMLTEAQIYCNDSIFTLTKTTKSICKCNVCCS